MEDGTRNLTVTLLIFEATDGKKTLTDALAKAFVSLFNPDSAWHASIDRDGGHAEGAGDGNPATGDHSHYVVCSGSQVSSRPVSRLLFFFFRYRT